MIARLWTGLAALLIVLGCVAAKAQTIPTYPPGSFRTQVVTVSIGSPRPTAWVKYLLILPNMKGTLTKSVMLFAGGDGLLSLSYDGNITTSLSGNFLVRTRERFAAAGYATAVIDAPNGVALDGNARLSADYSALMTEVIKDVRARTAVKTVWLVGTSAGTLSATNIAARNPKSTLPPPLTINQPGVPDGIALPSPQDGTIQGFCGKTVFDATLSAINVPTYLAAHQSDTCGCSPPANMPSVLTALTKASPKTGHKFTGGLPPQSGVCDAFSPHGFYGIEDQVIADMLGWMENPSTK